MTVLRYYNYSYYRRYESNGSAGGVARASFSHPLDDHAGPRAARNYSSDSVGRTHVPQALCESFESYLNHRDCYFAVRTEAIGIDRRDTFRRL